MGQGKEPHTRTKYVVFHVVSCAEGIADRGGRGSGETVAGGEGGRDSLCGGEPLLAVVEDDQELARAEGGGEGHGQGAVAGLADAEGLGDGGEDESGIADRREIDEDGSVGEGRGDVVGDGEGETGFADAVRSSRHFSRAGYGPA